MRLVAGCERHWADARAWRRYLLRGMQTLFDTQVAMWVEAAGVDERGRPKHVELASSGWPTPAARATFFEYLEMGGPAMMPDLALITQRLMQRGAYTGRRRDHVPDRHWYDSPVYRQYIHPTGVEDYVVSMRVMRRLGTTSSLSVHRAIGAPPFEPRHRRLLALLHAELEPRIARTLALRRQFGLHGLTPRQRQTLNRLACGESEKQVAAHLGVSPTTVHGYVRELYRYFQVTSRGGLLAYLLQHAPRPTPDALKAQQRTLLL